LALIFLLIALLVGVLQDRAQQALLRERRKNDELSVLRAALDQSEVGVVLLDNELGARFINRAYRNLWQLSDKVADSKPSFISLLYHARDAQAYDVSADQMEEYIAGRVASVQMGDERPVDLRLTNGKVIRCRHQRASRCG
jgi:PAS domain-containing protein